MIVAGIDIGLSGAVALVGDGPVISVPTCRATGPEVFRTPLIAIKKKGHSIKHDYDLKGMYSLLQEHRLWIDLVVMERVHAMPKQGVSSMFSFGRGAGLWEMALVACGLPYELVTPQAWKKVMLFGTAKDKGAAILRAQQLFPSANIGRNHNIADSLLLAEYGRRILMPSLKQEDPL